MQPPNKAVFFEKTILSAAEQAAESEDLMEFFNSAVDTLQTIVVGLGPLAILFPECKFKLIDGTGKKIRVCNEVASAIGLKNLVAEHLRGEDEKGKYDFVVSRAVMQLPDLMKIIKKNFKKKGQNALPNGLICLKGGNLQEELKDYRNVAEITPLSTFFEEEWFKQDKQLIYVPA